MRLTLGTDYALRTLMFVAVKGGSACTIAEIAGTFAVSKAHLMKVVNKLVRQGYLAIRAAARAGESGVAGTPGCGNPYRRRGARHGGDWPWSDASPSKASAA